jgi:hypothetical protein
MLKKIKIICLATLLIVASQLQGRGQYLDVPVVFQERSKWCWAAVSQCVLGYYGKEYEQCDIAEYTRSVATWHSFGSVHCCTGGCDHINYMNGMAGSIEDILLQLGNLQTHWFYGGLSRQNIAFEMEGGRPFIIRWGWTGGGGHFLVVHGLSGNSVYYLDPLYGSMVGSFMHMHGSAHHTWTSTLRMDLLTSVADGRGPGEEIPGPQSLGEGFLVYPNPASGLVRLALDGTWDWGVYRGPKRVPERARAAYPGESPREGCAGISVAGRTGRGFCAGCRGPAPRALLPGCG